MTKFSYGYVYIIHAVGCKDRMTIVRMASHCFLI